MAKYKLRNLSAGNGEDIIDTESTPKKYIPKDPENSDYAQYLEWVAAGNTPEAAD
tara:strand:+ start:1141 stop:1305 length:165 start_codon:yes stop_codon:yes gene_type:complete